MAVVLDAFSRRVVGWALNRSLRSTVAVDALQHAIEIESRCQVWSIILIAGCSMRLTITLNCCGNMVRPAA